ncbi:MAG: hypothetical protein AAFX81_04750 [Pseudomonadota bacterium]
MAQWPSVVRATARMMQPEGSRTVVFVADAARSTTATCRRFGLAAIDFEFPARARKLSARVLFLVSGRENGLSLRSLPRFAGAAPLATAAVVPALGHGWPGQDPALFAETVRAQVPGTTRPFRLQIVEPVR